jgi:exopolyphosphatase/guanosine-5'-triphosphate,3'-diphosphate pyrophosphatase
VAELLGRPPRGAFAVAVRDPAGDPLVIRNDPVLDDGTPMPTRFWLVGPAQRKAIDRLEAAGGVRQAEASLAEGRVSRAHSAYAAGRDAALPAAASPRPAGGVGGTRRGVKCLHAHYAWYLSGGVDPVGEWVAQALEAPARRPAAAVDCGTNSTRLLVAHPGAGAIERVNVITRLGEGVDRNRRLAPAAVERTVRVLERFRAVMDRYGVDRLRVTATSAARDAANREEFFDAAEKALGARPELLPGEQEGRLSFAGATAGLHPAGGPWLVADIGGGSTELVVGSDPGGEPEAAVSLDVGCVRLTERFLPGDPPGDAALSDARAYVASALSSAVAAHPAIGSASTLVGLAGTVSALAQVDQALGAYRRDRVHQYRLEAGRVDELLSRLAAMSTEERRRLPGLEPERADVIVGGALVLSELMRRLGFGICVSSEADILDGLVLSMGGGPTI